MTDKSQGSPFPEREALATRLHIYARNCSADRMYDAADDLYAAAKLLRSTPSGADVREALVEAGAQALANDVWHPPIALAILSKHEADRFRRQAGLVLDAALSTDARPMRGMGSLAKEPEASGGLCAAAPHAVRVGVASADLPTTSEHMDVTAGETAPHSASRPNGEVGS